MFHQSAFLGMNLPKSLSFQLSVSFVGFFNNYSVQPLPMQRLQNTAHSEGWHGKKKKKICVESRPVCRSSAVAAAGDVTVGLKRSLAVEISNVFPCIIYKRVTSPNHLLLNVSRQSFSLSPPFHSLLIPFLYTYILPICQLLQFLDVLLKVSVSSDTDISELCREENS